MAEKVATPTAVLALIAEVDRLRGLVAHMEFPIGD